MMFSDGSSTVSPTTVRRDPTMPRIRRRARVFARIGPAGTRIGDLADQARISKQTAGFLVDQLERVGYVRREPDPSDARARLVRIAERGQAVVEVARRTEARVSAEWTRHLGRRDTRTLQRTLTRLREITDPFL